MFYLRTNFWYLIFLTFNIWSKYKSKKKKKTKEEHSTEEIINQKKFCVTKDNTKEQKIQKKPMIYGVTHPKYYPHLTMLRLHEKFDCAWRVSVVKPSAKQYLNVASEVFTSKMTLTVFVRIAISICIYWQNYLRAHLNGRKKFFK